MCTSSKNQNQNAEAEALRAAVAPLLDLEKVYIGNQVPQGFLEFETDGESDSSGNNTDRKDLGSLVAAGDKASQNLAQDSSGYDSGSGSGECSHPSNMDNTSSNCSTPNLLAVFRIFAKCLRGNSFDLSRAGQTLR